MQKQNSEISFEAIRKAFLKEPNITEKKMFGTIALTIKGKVFVFSWKGRLVVKLPKERVEEIVASKKGVYFDPGHGRISKEWIGVTPTTKSEWLNLAKEAKNFVSNLKR